MCGRYTLTADGADIWDLIEGSFPAPLLESISLEQVELLLDIPSRRKYNIVPTSYEPILYEQGGKTVFALAEWWLLPSWAGKQVRWRISAMGEKTFSWIGPPGSHFNSRWDTLTKPGNHYWKGLLDSKRCLIPADGFIEWPDDALRPKDQDKIPHYFSLQERSPFFFAGVYDTSLDDEGNPFVSFNIITVGPNAMLKRLPHHRMPAILTEEAVAQWISPLVRADEAGKLLNSTSDELMAEYPISKLVNTPKNELPAVLEPLRQDHR